MTDEKLRQNQRAAAQGDQVAQARQIRERLRTGDLSRAAVRICAYTGDEASRTAHGTGWCPCGAVECENTPGETDTETWFKELVGLIGNLPPPADVKGLCTKCTHGRVLISEGETPLGTTKLWGHCPVCRPGDWSAATLVAVDLWWHAWLASRVAWHWLHWWEGLDVTKKASAEAQGVVAPARGTFVGPREVCGACLSGLHRDCGNHCCCDLPRLALEAVDRWLAKPVPVNMVNHSLFPWNTGWFDSKLPFWTWCALHTVIEPVWIRGGDPLGGWLCGGYPLGGWLCETLGFKNKLARGVVRTALTKKLLANETKRTA